MNSLLMRGIEVLAHAQSCNLIETISQRVAGCQSVITPIMAHAGHHIYNPLAQTVRQHFLETSYQSSLVTPTVEAIVVTPPTSTPFETYSDGEHQRRLEPAQSLIIREVTAFVLIRQWAMNMGYEALSRRKRQIWKNQRSAQRKLSR